MASPTNTAISPPMAAHPSKKRPSVSTTDVNSAKRRKPSQASATSGMHPLRQTSFPSESSPIFPAHGYTRSPSVESSVTGSVAALGKRPAKATAARSIAGSSVRGGKTRTVTSVAGGSKKGAKSRSANEPTPAVNEEEEEEDEEEEEEEDRAGATVNNVQEVDDSQERQKLQILLEAFNADQSDRYAAFRRAKLNPPTVRRLVNQTLSQSVPEPVVKTVNGFTKIFIGEIIERAREVQAQWAAAAARRTAATDPATATTAHPLPAGIHPIIDNPSSSNIPRASGGSNSASSQQQQQAVNHGQLTLSESPKEGSLQNHDLGPLLPAHIREALRRYRRDCEGGLAGLRCLSRGIGLRYPCATGGKKLFR